MSTIRMLSLYSQLFLISRFVYRCLCLLEV